MKIINHKKVLFVRATRREALALIKSLAAQILNNDSNADRLETFTESGQDFTIAVTPEIKED